jgi:hypothetical protein
MLYLALYVTMETYDKLNEELRQAGVPEYKFMEEIGQPIDSLVNSKLSSRPYIEIILKYLPSLSGNELEMAIRALSEKGNTKALPAINDIIKNSDNYSDVIIWVAENAVKRIRK